MPPTVDALEPAVSAAIRLEGVTAGYRGEGNSLIGATLDVPPGATAVVHGGSGAGKSTLLHVLRAALAPRAGRVGLLGSDVAMLPPKVRAALKRRIGYVAQSPILFEDASVFDNVAAPLTMDAPAGPRTGADVNDLLAYLGLSDVGARPARSLSDVQRRLAAIARAFVIRPDIVLADEPLTGLGADAAGRVLRLLSEIARQRAAVVITTQSPEDFATLPAQRLRLERGQLAAAPA